MLSAGLAATPMLGRSRRLSRPNASGAATRSKSLLAKLESDSGRVILAIKAAKSWELMPPD